MKVYYETTCFPEFESVRGNYCVSGDDDYDRAQEDKILEQLEWNDWAWCIVEVTASIPGIPLAGTASLGGCSYADEKEFNRSGYYEDMKKEAFADLMEQIRRVKSTAAKFDDLEN